MGLTEARDPGRSSGHRKIDTALSPPSVTSQLKKASFRVI